MELHDPSFVVQSVRIALHARRVCVPGGCSWLLTAYMQCTVSRCLTRYLPRSRSGLHRMLGEWCLRRQRPAMRALRCPRRPCAALGQSLWPGYARASCGCWTPADRCADPCICICI